MLQLGRRNLTDDQRADIGDSVLERRTALEQEEKRKRAPIVGKQGGRGKKTLPVASSGRVHDRSKESRAAVAKAARVSEHKLRAIREIKKAAPERHCKLMKLDCFILKPQINQSQKTICDTVTL
jgi:hypothetical protein